LVAAHPASLLLQCKLLLLLLLLLYSSDNAFSLAHDLPAGSLKSKIFVLATTQSSAVYILLLLMQFLELLPCPPFLLAWEENRFVV
jgi:hypothetical protein